MKRKGITIIKLFTVMAQHDIAVTGYRAHGQDILDHKSMSNIEKIQAAGIKAMQKEARKLIEEG